MARCPVHEGDGRAHSPSLSITDKAGTTLVHCHAGCDQRLVIEALRAAGVWNTRLQPETTWREWRVGVRYPAEWGVAVAEYQYSAADGADLYSVVRFKPKDFRPGYCDNGRWVWKKHPAPVLYHLPEVLEAPIVFVTEGEKDTETLRDWGFVATTNAGGAQAPWLESYSEALSGREVILIPDNDPPGKARVLRIARALLGRVTRLVVFDLNDAKDITDWFERGHSELELIATVEEGTSHASA